MCQSLLSVACHILLYAALQGSVPPLLMISVTLAWSLGSYRLTRNAPLLRESIVIIREMARGRKEIRDST